MDIILLEDVTGNSYSYGKTCLHTGSDGIVLGSDDKPAYNTAVTLTNSGGTSEKYLCTADISSGSYIGISLTGHYSGYSKVNSTRTLTRTTKAGSSDFFISGDGWYAGVGSDTIPVSSEVQIYLTSSDTWLSGEDGLNAVLSGGYDLTIYYDKTPSSGGQIRIITAG